MSSTDPNPILKDPIIKQKSVKSSLFYLYKLIRTVLVAIFFVLGCTSIIFTQFCANILLPTHYNLKHGLISLTKKHFVVLMTTILDFVCPSKIRITSETSSIPKGSFKIIDNNLHSALSPNAVYIANHQIYTDWVFLWWVTYTGKFADSVVIMLKDSLKKIPILGYGMSNFQFIFLTRKWQEDKETIKKSLNNLDFLNKIGSTDNYHDDAKDLVNFPGPKMKWPYNLILFPEGTNLSPTTRFRSNKYCEKLGIPPLRHVLLPRITGLRHSLRSVQNTCEFVYDVTIGYSGIEKNQYGESIYNLKSVIIDGNSPKITDIYIKRIKLTEIPLGDESQEDDEVSVKEFEEWLFKVWKEKDDLMEIYYNNGTFTPNNLENKEVVIASLKPKNTVLETLSIFAFPITIFAILRLFYKLVLKLFYFFY